MKVGCGKNFSRIRLSLRLPRTVFSDNGWEKLENFVISGVFYGQIFLTVLVQGNIIKAS